MDFDWRSVMPHELEGPAEHFVNMDERASEMTPWEWRVFSAAAQLYPPRDTANAVALIRHLPEFDYYFPAADSASLGYLLARHNYGIPEKDVEFMDCA